MQYRIKDDLTINIIRGKNFLGGATMEDVSTLLEHIDGLEAFLDEHDEDDVFGTEGWRHRAGLE